MKEFKMNVEVTITEEMIENIIVGALEGGSNYWYMLGEGIPPRDEEGTPMSVRISRKIVEDPDFKLPIYDAEDEDGEPIGHLTQEGMLNAFKIVSEKYPWHYQNVMTECGDADTDDVFFQCAVLGDIVYG